MYCFAFPDRASFLTACDALGWLSEVTEEAPVADVICYTADRAIDEIGAIATTPGTYDEEGVELTPPVWDNRHHVNYQGAPIASWDTYRVTPATPRRLFAGVGYSPTFGEESPE